MAMVWLLAGGVVLLSILISTGLMVLSAKKLDIPNFTFGKSALFVLLFIFALALHMTPFVLWAPKIIYLGAILLPVTIYLVYKISAKYIFDTTKFKCFTVSCVASQLIAVVFQFAFIPVVDSHHADLAKMIENYHLSGFALLAKIPTLSLVIGLFAFMVIAAISLLIWSHFVKSVMGRLDFPIPSFQKRLAAGSIYLLLLLLALTLSILQLWIVNQIALYCLLGLIIWICAYILPVYITSRYFYQLHWFKGFAVQTMANLLTGLSIILPLSILGILAAIALPAYNHHGKIMQEEHTARAVEQRQSAPKSEVTPDEKADTTSPTTDAEDHTEE